MPTIPPRTAGRCCAAIRTAALGTMVACRKRSIAYFCNVDFPSRGPVMTRGPESRPVVQITRGRTREINTALKVITVAKLKTFATPDFVRIAGDIGSKAGRAESKDKITTGNGNVRGADCDIIFHRFATICNSFPVIRIQRRSVKLIIKG